MALPRRWDTRVSMRTACSGAFGIPIKKPDTRKNGITKAKLSSPKATTSEPKLARLASAMWASPFSRSAAAASKRSSPRAAKKPSTAVDTSASTSAGSGAASVVVAVPAVRLGGIFLALATLAFGLFADNVVFVQGWALGDVRGLDVPHPVLGPIDFASDRGFFVLAAVLLALTLAFMHAVRRGGTGQILTSLRGSELGARSVGVNPTPVKIRVVALSAFVLEGRAAVPGALERAYELFPRLGERRRQLAGTLSGGEQRMLSLARGFPHPPRLLIADELSLGPAPIIVEDVFSTLERLRAEGTAILVVEQHANQAFGLADDVVVLATGQVAHEGPASDARAALHSLLPGTPAGAAT